jgi:hypothetical protein
MEDIQDIPDSYYDWLKGRDEELEAVVGYLQLAIKDLETYGGMVTPAQAVANLILELKDGEHRGWGK